MPIFLFIATIIFEIIHLYRALFRPFVFALIPLIIIIIYIICFTIVYRKPETILGNKKGTGFIRFLLFILIPLLSFAVLYDNDQTATVYFYNESSIEEIEHVEIKRIYSNPTLSKVLGNRWKTLSNPSSLIKNQMEKNNIHIGTYEIRIKTSDSKKSIKYMVTLNKDNITLNKNDIIYLCYGGKNFFEFHPSEKFLTDTGRKERQAYKSNSKFIFYYAEIPFTDETQSIKTLIEGGN